MKISLIFLGYVCMSIFCHSTQSQMLDLKTTAVQLIEREEQSLIELSQKIWYYAETGLLETRSACDLANYIEKQGFTVTRGVAEMPTAFIAEFGSGQPIIGLLGEYDALPGLSQTASPQKEELETGAAGHGCGHNLLGVGSLGAAIAIKDLIAIGKLQGTVRYYGTPAEENYSGKIYMLRAGLFDDLDVCLAWHPSGVTKSDTESALALVCLDIDFFGKTAHAAADPWNGNSALDGAELFTHGINLLREHVKPSVRMHYIYQHGGAAPNIVPDYARVECWLRDWKHVDVDSLLERVRNLAKGAGLMADVETKVTVQSGAYESLVNEEGSKILHENLEWLGPIHYTEEEQEFARILLKSFPKKDGSKKDNVLTGKVAPLVLPPPPPERGSTDLSDVSWRVPLIHLRVATMPQGIPGHSWGVVACGGMSIGQKGMLYAAKALAATAIDLYVNADARQRIQNEFKEKTVGFVYKSYLPEGPPPIPSKESSER